jgi:hypothetical protein
LAGGKHTKADQQQIYTPVWGGTQIHLKICNTVSLTKVASYSNCSTISSPFLCTPGGMRLRQRERQKKNTRLSTNKTGAIFVPKKKSPLAILPSSEAMRVF